MKSCGKEIAAFIIMLCTLTTDAQSIVAGGRHSLAICKDSTVQAWGYNGFGQLGNGNLDPQTSGQQVLNVEGVVAVAAGLFHSIVIREDGSVFAFGRNATGALGDGTLIDRSIAVPLPLSGKVIQAAGGGEHSLFLKSDQTVWSTGRNNAGQLGDGTIFDRSTPIPINGLNGIKQVAAGAEFSLFLKQDGTVWSCGHNGYGQLGIGSNTSSKIPVQIPNLDNIIFISAGEWHALFVKADGTVWATGRNQYGQLGDGTTSNKNIPTQIISLQNVIQAEAGGIHSVFVKRDGTVWSCGLNSGGNNDGQLGDGTNTDRSTPVQVSPDWGNNIRIKHAEATREHTLFLAESGELWACGRNNYGQLGVGSNTSNALKPVSSNTICNVLSVQNNSTSLHSLYSVFPNPVKDIVHIFPPDNRNGMYALTLYDINGKQVINFDSSGVQSMELSTLERGLYFLKIRTQGESQFIPIILQ